MNRHPETGLTAGNNRHDPGVCLLGVSPDTGNMGVNVLAAGLVKSAVAWRPRARISFLDYARSPSVWRCPVAGHDDVEVPIVNMRFSIKLFQSSNIAVLLAFAMFIRCIPSRRLRRTLRMSNTCLREIENAEVIGSIAGGDSFSDIYGLDRFLYVTLPQLLVMVMGKPLIQLPQTFGPYRGIFCRLLARFILRRSARIFSRERKGVEVVRKSLGNGPASCQIGFA